MAEREHDDLETKVEDAFIELMKAELPDGFGLYASEDMPKNDPSITVRAVRAEQLTSTAQGDIINVDVTVTMRYAVGSQRRGIFRHVENAVGTLDATPVCKSLPERVMEASRGALHVASEPSFFAGAHEIDENDIVRTLGVRLAAAHAKQDTLNN